MRTESAIGLTLLAITGCTGQHTGHTPIRGNKTFPNENDGAIRAQKMRVEGGEVAEERSDRRGLGKTFPNEYEGAVRAQKNEGGGRRGGGGAKRQKGVGEDIPQ